MTPSISVFITSYNQKEYLTEAIESVLCQTLMPSEILICDDASTDGSRELIMDYAHSHPSLIRPFLHEKNLGIARNKAFAQRQARGDFVTYLDGDDIFLPGKLETESAVLRDHPEVKIVYSNFYFIDREGRKTRLWADGVTPPSGYVFPEVFARDFPHNTLFRNELLSRSCLEEVGYYDEGRITHEDWDLKIRLTSRFRVAYCPTPLIGYRMHGGGISRAAGGALLLGQMKEVYLKNRGILTAVSPQLRKGIEDKLFPLFARRAGAVISEDVKGGNLANARRHYRELLGDLPFRTRIRGLFSGLTTRGSTK